jgi:hypothetical protein
MNLRDLLGAVRRRWYVVIVGLLLTAGMCVGATKLVPVEYTAGSSVLLLPPNSTVGTGGNPYLSLGGLQGAVDVLGRAMTSEQVVTELTGGSPDETYTFEADATTSGPLLVLAVKSRSSDGALGLMQSVLDRAPTVLRDLQTEVNAPTESLITMSVIAQDSTVEVDRKSQLRALIVVLAVGLALTFFATLLFDTAVRRRGRAVPAPAPGSVDGAPGTGSMPPVAAARPDQATGGTLGPRSRSGLRTPTRSSAERTK